MVIPVHDQLEFTLKVSRSLAGCAQRTSFEVIVIDDQSDVAAFLALADSQPACAEELREPGLFAQLQPGGRYARGEYLVLLNNDTEVPASGWMRCCGCSSRGR